MVNPTTALEFARVLKASVVELTGDCGHLAPGCEAQKVNAAVEAALK
jgi:homoserine O-acetyltransferase